MDSKVGFKIDLSERFPHLSHAPIVEAVIEIRARATVEWEEGNISAALKAVLSDYPKIQSERAVEQLVQFVPPGQAGESRSRDIGWVGLRCASESQPQVTQFTRDLFSFSRLRPYESWEKLSGEAVRLWRLFTEIARPSEVQRIGLRFINRLELDSKEMQLGAYIRVVPQAPSGLALPLAGFLHQESLTVPGNLYGINVIRTIQLAQGSEGAALILDIDVGTLSPFALREEVLVERLGEMRWLKNKVFFGTITEQAREVLK